MAEATPSTVVIVAEAVTFPAEALPGLVVRRAPSDDAWVIDLPITDALRELLEVEAGPCVGVIEPRAGGGYVVTLGVVDEVDTLDEAIAAVRAEADRMRARLREALVQQLVTLPGPPVETAERDYALARRDEWCARATEERVKVVDLSARVAVLEGEAEILRRVAWGLVRNVARLSDLKPRWAHVSDVTGLGSTAASKLCVDHGVDPDDDVGRQDGDEGEVGDG